MDLSIFLAIVIVFFIVMKLLWKPTPVDLPKRRSHYRRFVGDLSPNPDLSPIEFDVEYIELKGI